MKTEAEMLAQSNLLLSRALAHVACPDALPSARRLEAEIRAYLNEANDYAVERGIGWDLFDAQKRILDKEQELTDAH